MIRFENVTKIYPRPTRPALDEVTSRSTAGEFVFLVGRVGLRQVDLPAAGAARGGADEGVVLVAGQDLGRHARLEGSAAAPRDRSGLPGLPAAAEQDRVRERRLRAAGHRQAGARHPHSWCPRCSSWSAWRARRSASRTSSPVVSSSASRSPGPSSTGRDPAGRRADRKPRPARPASTSCACSTGSTAPAPRSSWPPTTTRSSTDCASASSSSRTGDVVRDEQDRGVYGYTR